MVSPRLWPEFPEEVAFLRPREAAADPRCSAAAGEAPFAPESAQERLAVQKALRLESEAARARWMSRARAEDWSGPVAPMEVFVHAGIETNPRLDEAYRAEVVKELGLHDPKAFPYLSAADLAAARETFHRCAPGLWRKGSPSTVVRHVMHDVVTIGGPVRGAPLRLKGEAAEFVETALKELVGTGVYEKGSSPWGSFGLFRRGHLPGRAGRSAVWWSTTEWSIDRPSARSTNSAAATTSRRRQRARATTRCSTR